MKKITTRLQLESYAYLAPGVLLVLGFLVIPIIQGFYYSLFNYNLASSVPKRFIGLKNFTTLLTDPHYLQTFFQTLCFLLFALLFEFLLGFFFALLLKQNFVGKKILRGIMLLPWMMPQVVTAFTWSWILNGTSGILNKLLHDMKLISNNIAWLSTPGLTLGIIIFIDIWTFTPFITLVLYAGLQGIPVQLYEAATIDGANMFTQMLRITVPMLKKSASVAFLMRSMVAIRTFDSVWIITRGGPAGTTELLGTYAYKRGMVGFNIGLGSAATSIIFILCLLVSIRFIGVVLKKT
ncbi:carbohydrate ABC transporter permease [Treponema sp. Marseille-Q4523]|uniref:carbohydrate ABC transporter permease n=1 Tax=Treponema sp. Marseille-Q4523 TaxID=2810610 RepID=UPI001961CFA8|nr:sugar ABC transporter permease [Treponema sp. Marseille-Q4523]MBM7022806.1 sugar ABC transporter permease [Treponema sp. Marseille-Q4523]